MCENKKHILKSCNVPIFEGYKHTNPLKQNACRALEAVIE